MVSTEHMQTAINGSFASEDFKATVEAVVTDIAASESFKVSAGEFVKGSARNFLQDGEFARGFFTIMSGAILPSDDRQQLLQPTVREVVFAEFQPKGLIRAACRAGGHPAEEVTQSVLDAIDALAADGLLAEIYSFKPQRRTRKQSMPSPSPTCTSALPRPRGGGGSHQDVCLACVRA